MRDIITELMDMKRDSHGILWKLCAHIFEDLDEMGKFLEEHSLPKLGIQQNQTIW